MSFFEAEISLLKHHDHMFFLGCCYVNNLIPNLILLPFGEKEIKLFQVFFSASKKPRESAGKVLQMTFPGCLEGSGWIKELPEDWEKR